MKYRSEEEVRKMLELVKGLPKPYYANQKGPWVTKEPWIACLRWVLGEFEVQFPSERKKM